MKMKWKKIVIGSREARVLALAASQMEDDWSISEIAKEHGLTPADVDAFERGLSKLRSIARNGGMRTRA